MANSLLTIDMITRKSLEILENNLVITRNVNRQYDDSFAVEGAKIGSTLRIRLPDRALVTDGAALQVQDDNEQFTTLTVSTQQHVGINFTSAELTMQLDDFAERVLKPRISQLASTVDANVANTYKQIGNSVGSGETITPGDVFTIADCFAANPQTRESTGSLFQFVALTSSTSTTTATVTVAPIYSAANALCTVVSLPATAKAVIFVGAASGQFAQNMVYHRDAIAFATADLLLPQGVDMASRAVHNGISLRVVRQYDINNDRMPCRVDVLYGFNTIRPQMACRIFG